MYYFQIMKLCNLFKLLVSFFILLACKNGDNINSGKAAILTPVSEVITSNKPVGKNTSQVPAPAADDPSKYIGLLKDKKVALVVNQTSRVKSQHLADYLISQKINVSHVFAPEHGFRGKEDAGTKIDSGIDQKTGLKIISLYGKNKKPSSADLEGLEAVVFDIQDVGVRFYTYISTLHYVMEACAENNIPLILLDRPNPNGHYVDGPLLKKEFVSFVGMHPVPIVYGMTIGEYAQMINGQGWLKESLQCKLTVIPCKNYTHQSRYDLPIKPSPNLPNRRSVLLYPSLCLFEPTTFSIGRGTDTQFQVLGHPEWGSITYSFTPRSMPGATNPKHKDVLCRGHYFDFDMQILENRKEINLSYIEQAYISSMEAGFTFWTNTAFFDKLAGSDALRLQLEKGMTRQQIRATWQEDLNAFLGIRKKYLLYKD